MTYYIRASVYKEKARDYISAAKVIGAGPFRIVFKHLLPNVVSTLVTFAPFTIAAAISSITALDFLGYGLPPPTPSWGELLKQGILKLDWKASSITTGTVLRMLLNFIKKIRIVFYILSTEEISKDLDWQEGTNEKEFSF